MEKVNWTQRRIQRAYNVAMSKAALSLLLSLLFVRQSLANGPQYSSIPEDLFAFPKFRVVFLNKQLIANETAQKWLSEGLPGGEDQFMDRDWQNIQRSARSEPRTIDGNEEVRI